MKRKRRVAAPPVSEEGEIPHVTAFRAVTGDDYANRLGKDFDRYFHEFDILDEDAKNREYRANERRGRSFQSELGAKVTYAGSRVGLLEDGMRRILDVIQQPTPEPVAPEGAETKGDAVKCK